MKTTPIAITATLSAALVLTGCAAPSTHPGNTTPPTATSASTTTPSSTPPLPTATVPAGKPGVPRGGAPNITAVHQQDASSVAASVMQTFATTDTRIDTTPFDAERRALPLLGDPLAAALRVPVGGNGGSNAAWTQLYAHHGWTTATATVVALDVPDATGDTTTLAVRQLAVATTAHGANGWQPPATKATWIVTLRRASKRAPWRVTQVYQNAN